MYFLLKIYERMFFNQLKKINLQDIYLEENKLIEGITAHIQTVGDRHFFQSEWVGLPGSGLGIEAVIIEAGRSIDNSDINYCAYCHNGIQDLVPCGIRSGTVGLNRQIISLKINVGERLRETYDGFIEIIFVGEPGVKKFLFGENCVLEAVSKRLRNWGWMAGSGVIPTGCRDRVGWTASCGPRPPERSITARRCVLLLT